MKQLKKAMSIILAATLTIGSTTTTEASVKKTVKSVTITNVNSKQLVLKPNKTYKLNTKVSVQGKASKKVRYYSSNPKVASVTVNGTIKALKQGSTTITVKSQADAKKTASIKVVVGTPITKISLDNYRKTAAAGDQLTLNPVISPEHASIQDLTFTSNNPEVADVSSNGVVSCYKKGIAQITISSNDNSGKRAVCRITVTEPEKEQEEQPEEVLPITPVPPSTPGSSVTPDTSNDPYAGYTMVWNDEFDGDCLNTDDWNYETHEPGWVNNEWQAYVQSDENIFVKDGNLYIRAIKTGEGEDATYTSGRINTQNKHDFTYGRFEVRAKVPAGKGYLPAFWMMPTDENLYGQWPRCGEIDIMEVMGQDTKKAYGTIHYGNPHNESQGTKILETGDYSSEFHTYAVDWEPGKITWYIDGEKYHEENDWYSTTVGQGTVSYPAPFDQPFYLILNLAVGGSWVGYPDETTDFENQAFVIDYVRAYQKTDGYNEDNVTKPVKPDVTLRDPDSEGNYILNGTFAEEDDFTGTQNWQFMTALGGDASAQIVEDATFGQQAKAVKISTVDAGSVDYSVQFVQPNIPLDQGNEYTVTFDAYASENRNMIVNISAPDRSYQRYLPDTMLDLTPEKQTYTYTFRMESEKDANGRLEFNLGNTPNTSDVFISNVSVKQTGTFEIDDSKKVLTDGNHVYNGSFQEGADRMDYWEVVDVNNHASFHVTGLSDQRRLYVSTADCTSIDDVQLRQSELPLTPNSSYELSFDAALGSDSRKEIKVMVAGHEQSFVLSGENARYTLKFTTGDHLDQSELVFSLGINDIVLLDNIRLVEDSLIKNGNFNAGLAGYEVYAYTPSDISYTVDSQSEDNAFDITIKNTGDADWHIQLKQNNVTLEKDQWYTLKFDAKSSLDRNITYAIQRDGSKHNDDWTPYVQETVGLTSSYQTISKTFQMRCDTDTESILNFAMGTVDGNRIDTQHRICIDNISLELAAPSDIPSTPSVEAGTEMIQNGSFSEGEANWTQSITAPGAAVITFDDNKATAEVQNVGTEDWHVQFKQSGLTLEPGCTYALTLEATSTEARQIKLSFLDESFNWYGGGDYAIDQPAENGGYANQITCEFTVPGDKPTNDNITFGIGLGKTNDVETPASTITITNVSLKKLSQ